MSTPKLKQCSITVSYGCDDSYESEQTFAGKPADMILEAIDELARMYALYIGDGNKAVEAAKTAVNRVAEWRQS